MEISRRIRSGRSFCAASTSARPSSTVPTTSHSTSTSFCKPASTALTPRQREVLQLVAEGRGTKEIATILSVSVKTVEFHRFRIMQQLDIHTTADLTKYAITHGITGL